MERVPNQEGSAALSAFAANPAKLPIGRQALLWAGSPFEMAQQNRFSLKIEHTPGRRICYCPPPSLPGPIIQTMARGWESKSVEAQQSEASEKSSTPRINLTPEAAARHREQETLRLSRQSVVHQLEKTTNPRHRKLLEETLADLDKKLNRFNS